ncbi:unnamed protein product [Rhizophagus irregularis]|nr:unnamed protein product [Rhizophagus irregularis]
MVITFGVSYSGGNILLLDISNVNKYIWTDEFDLTSSTPTLVPITSLTTLPPQKLASQDIGFVIIGILIGGFSLSRNRNEANINQPDGNNYNPGQEIVQPEINKNINENKKNESNYNNNSPTNNDQSERNNYHPGAPPPVNNNKNIDENVNESNYQTNNNKAGRNDYYPGQEIVIDKTPIATNDEIQELKLEIQNLKQIIMQNKNQSASNSIDNN